MLSLIPVSLKDANAFVAEHHRHHKPTRGHKFSIGCEMDGRLVGVAIMGRPVSRYLDDGRTLEVNRLCTTGKQNACSMLYAAAVRAAKAMGYRKIITYTLDSEPGTSLRAAGWMCAGLPVVNAGRANAVLLLISTRHKRSCGMRNYCKEGVLDGRRKIESGVV